MRQDMRLSRERLYMARGQSRGREVLRECREAEAVRVQSY